MQLNARAGMTWSAFRPSDDKQQFGYLVPANMYAAGALERVLELNRLVWKDEELGRRATKLLADIESGGRQFPCRVMLAGMGWDSTQLLANILQVPSMRFRMGDPLVLPEAAGPGVCPPHGTCCVLGSAGIRKHGVVEVEPGVKMYAYEVDGRGNHTADFDDANGGFTGPGLPCGVLLDPGRFGGSGAALWGPPGSWAAEPLRCPQLWTRAWTPRPAAVTWQRWR